MKKCPPGVICIENMTMVFIVVAVCIIVYYLIKYYTNTDSRENNGRIKNINNTNIHVTDKNNSGGYGPGNLFVRPNYGYNNVPEDVLLNPYAPPLSNERYMVPINVQTNIGAVDTTYRQVGLLTPIHDSNKNKILPLMGRPVYVSRDKWQYYTMSDQKNSVKLPIIRNGKNASNEYGVDKLFCGDKIFVEGYNEAFKVTIYENETIRYLPSF